MKRFLLSLAVMVVVLSSKAFAEPQIALQQDLKQLEQEIEKAEAGMRAIELPLPKALATSRIEILKTTHALLDQRLKVLEHGIDMKEVFEVNTADLARVEQLTREIIDQSELLKAETAESKNMGGLIGALAVTKLETTKLNIQVLTLELFKAKYGIRWIPKTNSDVSATTDTIPKPVAQQPTANPRPANADLLTPKIIEKTFSKSDWQNGRYEDAIYFDIDWQTDKLNSPTRAVKGLLVFADLFGEPHFKIRWTLDKPLTPGKVHAERGIGFKYNQFESSHAWVRSTAVDDMTIWFEAQEVLYADGSRKKLTPSD